MVEIHTFLNAGLYFFGVYFLLANIVYIFTVIASWKKISTRKKNYKNNNIEMTKMLESRFSPIVSIIIPAFNEEKVILKSIKVAMQSSYKNIEIIVVNDGSKDKTFDLIKKEYNLVEAFRERKKCISEETVKDTYHSRQKNTLFVINQENSGKAEALNTGIEFASGQYICTVDADTFLQPCAILRLVHTFVIEGENTVAVSGTVRVLNGAVIDINNRANGKLPSKWISRFQIVEYIRAFYCGRMGWDQINATTLMSGALTMFNKQAIKDVGGFDKKSITEDFEIIMRMRKYYGIIGKKIKFSMLPRPLCWTLAPETYVDLRKQRIRWQRGLVETMVQHKNLLLQPRFGIVSYTNIPYTLVFEVMGGFIELASYIFVSLALYENIINFKSLTFILALGLVYSFTITLVGIYLEQVNYATNKSKGDLAIFMGAALMENFGYRQLMWIWRIESMVRMLFQKKSWGTHQTRDIQKSVVSEVSESDIILSA